MKNRSCQSGGRGLAPAGHAGDGSRTVSIPSGTLTEERVRLLEIVDDPEIVVERVVGCHSTLCARLGIDH